MHILPNKAYQNSKASMQRLMTIHLEFPEHHQTYTVKTIDAHKNHTGFKLSYANVGIAVIFQATGDRQFVGLFQLTDWRSHQVADWPREALTGPLCCSWPFSPQPGFHALWTARPCNCRRWRRRGTRDKAGRTSARWRTTAKAASVLDAPTANKS